MSAAFSTPPVLAFFCYFAGTACFLGALYWLIRPARRLRDEAGRWLLRALVIITLLSLGLTISSEEKSFSMFLPEISLLFFIAVLYIRFSQDRKILREALRIFGVAISCVAAWGISLAAGWCLLNLARMVSQNYDWLAPLGVGLLWNGLLIYLYAKNRERLPPDFRFHHLLQAALLAYLLLMLPALLEFVINAPKLQEALHAPPRLQRV